MTIIVPHRTTAEEAISIVDRSATTLFEGSGGSLVELVDRRKNWNGPVMDFSLTARVGFISVPIFGTVAVCDINVTVQCELPGIVKQFIGEDKIRAGIDRKIRGMLETSG
ncbi:MAG: hypothetical protein ABSG41_13255 [Bryobacteraceae bacterium]|jgi:hypothetical protein